MFFLNFHIFIIGYKTCLLFSHRCFFTTMSLSKQPLKETYHHYRHSLTVVVVVVVAKPMGSMASCMVFYLIFCIIVFSVLYCLMVHHHMISFLVASHKGVC